MSLNPFDVALLGLLNELARRSWAFDSFVVLISDANLLKGGVVIALLWWAWFVGEKHHERRRRNREIVLATLCASFVALVIASSLAVILPFRPRPLNEAELRFTLPYTVVPRTMERWSSFPSDHATLFFSLGTGLLFISRWVGTAVFIYAFVVICLPRIYTGLHFPTDILGGAVLGVGIAYLLIQSTALKSVVVTKAMKWEESSPASFYLCFFLLTFQIATLFHDVRGLGSFLFSTISRHI